MGPARENHIDPATISLGVPVDRYLLDAMRRLVRGGRWQINVPGARLWLLPDGLHLVWPARAEDVVSLLAADRVPGIPRDPDTLGDILLERGLAIPRQEGDTAQRYWRIAPEPLARDGKVITLSMLRLAQYEPFLPPFCAISKVRNQRVRTERGRVLVGEELLSDLTRRQGR